MVQDARRHELVHRDTGTKERLKFTLDSHDLRGDNGYR
jgi:hypothetical protein